MAAVTEQTGRRTKIHTVRAAADYSSTCASGGSADGPPILFIHGWSQNHLCWARQYESALADEFRLVAYDLRGHGMSEAPLEPEHYTDGPLWADDVAAIIDQLRLDRPVLVGWSYGAFVICDYVRPHGQDGIAAINFVEGVVKLGEAAFGTLIGPGFLDHFADATADDLPTNIRAMRSFVKTCLAKPLPADDFETALCWNVVVPARVPRQPRGARDRRDDVLRTLRCRCSSRTAGRTPSCCRRWPSTSSPPARPPRPPGTKASPTRRTSRSPSASTASWPRSRDASAPDGSYRSQLALRWTARRWERERPVVEDDVRMAAAIRRGLRFEGSSSTSRPAASRRCARSARPTTTRSCST